MIATSYALPKPAMRIEPVNSEGVIQRRQFTLVHISFVAESKTRYLLVLTVRIIIAFLPAGKTIMRK